MIFVVLRVVCEAAIFPELSDPAPLSDGSALAHAPSHFPEVGFEPRGFLEDRDQLCLAGRGGIAISKLLQMCPGFHRDFLIGGPGILGDPDAIWVGCSERIGP